MKILFICDGNICRSPAAAAFLKANLNNNNIEVRSAGIYASAGRPMISLMQQVLQEHGLDSEHSSQKISSEHLTWADLIFTMTRPQKFILLSMVPTMADKVFTLQEYIDNPAQDISVPRAETIEAYRACAEFIQGGCQALYKKVHKVGP